MANVHPMPGRRTTGRKPKTTTPRHSSTIRWMPSHHEHVQSIADQLGVPLSDYIAYVLAAAHGLEIPAYLRDVERLLNEQDLHLQEVLPLVLEA